MIFRYKRYRAFMVFAVIAVFAFYQFSLHSGWDVTSTLDAASSKLTPKEGSQVHLEHGKSQDRPAEAKQPPRVDFQPPAPPPQQAAPVTPPVIVHEQTTKELTSSTSSTSVIAAIKTPNVDLAPPYPADKLEPELEDISEIGEGRKEVAQQPSLESPAIHWSRQPEHFPVTATIQLPTGTPKAIPRIQYKFKQESSSAGAARAEKLKVISDAISHAWDGYRAKAWLKDEVKPVTGGFRDPFCGWAATLVDALDTLWIAGLTEEFEEAVKAVGQIDFTTSQRKDIPVFETTIRYLGGMVAAYDLSDGKYKILLDKAVELAEILMGAFDTPNRMPVTFYRWMPTFASQPHRAGTHVVLAEIGSLSMEFTRLAQLTREPKYYDAIDRITDAFFEWQNAVGSNATLIPGLFPVHIDASGCHKPAQIKSHYSHVGGIGSDLVVGDGAGVAAQHPVDKVQASHLDSTEMKDSSSAVTDNSASTLNKGKIIGWGDKLQEGDLDNPIAKAAVIGDTASDSLAKRQLGKLIDEEDQAKATHAEAVDQQETAAKKKFLAKDVCVPRGLASSTDRYGEFTIGGMADSLYEYLPKEYLLLGGLEDKYKDMYEKSTDAIIQHLLFRPMTPQNADILFTGEFAAHPPIDGVINGKLQHEGAHLTCFAGGMFALAAKIFDRKQDLAMAAKLTEGCVWAYNVTNSGIMPERMLLSACDSLTDCVWNETKYWEDLDPYQGTRANWNAKPLMPGQREHHKRQLDDDVQPTRSSAVKAVPEAVPNSVPELDMAAAHDRYVPPEPPSREEIVPSRIQDERLPGGVTRILSRKYILRPEAIESVFYMFRITGDEHWREVGWQMFEAIHKHTYAPYGASAIDDVTKTHPELEDSEESFWLAETLKYFYLLFSDPDLISLDDWVLNTEAHPFRRPKA